MNIAYPNLTAEIARRGIKKRAIARSIGVCDKALTNKLSGKSPFTWPEVCTIRNQFFPDLPQEILFAKSDVGFLPVPAGQLDRAAGADA